jgi:hypothetical protein
VHHQSGKAWNNQFWAAFSNSSTSRLATMTFWATANISRASLHNIDLTYVWTTATPHITFTQGCAALMNVGYQNVGASHNVTFVADNNDCISATLTNAGATCM